MNALFNQKLTPERYLANKEYFDEGLISALENQYKQNTKLKEDVEHEKTMKLYWHKKYSDLLFKTKDLKAASYNLSKKKRESDQDIEYLRRLITDLENEMKTDMGGMLQKISELQEENDRLKNEIQDYKYKEEKHKKRSSKNSNIPSSFEVIKAEANSRKKSSKKRGGQVGHVAHTSALRSNPNQIFIKTVKKAPTGAKPIKDDKGNILYYAVQEIDATYQTHVTETRYFIDAINGEELDEKEMKKHKINCVSYSSHLKSQVLYLLCKGTLPLERLTEMLNDLSENELSIQPSTVVNWMNEFAVLSNECREKILQNLLDSWVLNVDETGYRVDGKNRWMHAICNKDGVYYVLCEKRKDKETGPLFLLKDYNGTLVHDHLVSYYDLKCFHAECAAHIIRYLKAGIEFENSSDCGKLLLLIEKAIHRKNKLTKQGIKEMSESELKKIEMEYDDIIEKALSEYESKHPKAKKSEAPDSIKLFRRMKEYKTEHLRFLHDFDVPATNNLAEKMMRTVMPRKRISKQSYSVETGNYYAGLLTVVQTANMSGKNALKEIQQTMNS